MSILHGVMQSKSIGILLCILVGIALLAAWSAKATQASITHDEAGTYFNHVLADRSFWDCRTDPACWQDANNHLLNTALASITVSWLGPSPLALRLPNLLFFVMYLAGVLILLRSVAHSTIACVAGFALLCLNPYVLDFFALARGYGMGLGCMMASLGLAWLYVRDPERLRWLSLAFAFAVLAVFANLTYVAYFAALSGAVAVMVLARPRSGRSGRAFWRGVLLTALIPLLAAVMLLFYFYHPVGLLVQGGEFQYGAGSLWDTWLEFARNSLYGRDYFGPGTFTVAAVVSGLICLLSIGYGLLRGARKIETKFAFFSALVAGGLILFFLLNYWIMGAQFPSGRKTIILYPAMALVVFAALRRAVHPRLFAGIGLGLSLLLLLHVVNVFSLRSFREWWYDASTKDMVYDLAEISETNGRPVTLATEWIFFPATQFYVDTQNLPVELIRTGREVSSDAAATYYYVHPEHVQTLSPAYVVAAEYNGRVLMRQAEPD